jgi:hypothetical protein
MEKPSFWEISETRFHQLGKKASNTKNPKKPGFQRKRVNPQQPYPRR